MLARLKLLPQPQRRIHIDLTGKKVQKFNVGKRWEVGKRNTYGQHSELLVVRGKPGDIPKSQMFPPPQTNTIQGDLRTSYFKGEKLWPGETYS